MGVQSFNTETHYELAVYRVNGEFHANEIFAWVERRVLSVVADRFDRTAGHCFFTHRLLFRIFRLLVDEGIIVLVAPREVLRRRVAANVAIDTRRVHVK